VRGFRKDLITLEAFALIVCLAFSVRFRRDAVHARQELQAATVANDYLKKTLESMTIAMAAKERQIDRLEHADCGGRENPPSGAPTRPGDNKVSSGAAIQNGNGQLMGYAGEEAK
jgi:hypothetical protein